MYTLKHAGGAMMIRVLERLDRKKMTEEVRKGHDDVLNYLHKNVGRMDYPRYLGTAGRSRAGRWSGVQTVVNSAGLGGMRWGEEGSDAVAHLDAYRSDRTVGRFWGYAGRRENTATKSRLPSAEAPALPRKDGGDKPRARPAPPCP